MEKQSTIQQHPQQKRLSHDGPAAGPFFKPFIQPKLSINAPGDVYEQEADVMADKVMRMDGEDAGSSFFNPSAVSVQHKCQHCEEEEKKVQRKENSTDTQAVNREGESYVQSLQGKGSPLSQNEKNFFEPRFGYDFSNVRLHTGADADKSARNINALAYTHGSNIVFGANQHEAGSESGKKLMAHELTHVVQQQGNIGPKLIQRETPNRTAPVNQSVTENITNAPPAYAAAYNKSITWSAKFDVMFDAKSNRVVVVMRLFSTAPVNLKESWKNIIEDRWGKGKFAIEAWNSCPPATYPVDVNIQWVDDAAKAHYTITPSNPGEMQGGRAGVGGTTGMTHWGTADSSDVPHEFGHMLGNAEEYFTTNGIDYSAGGTKSGFRDRGGGIMNNPTEAPFPRHYDLVKNTFINMMHLPADKTRVVDTGILYPPLINCDNYQGLPKNAG